MTLLPDIGTAPARRGTSRDVFAAAIVRHLVALLVALLAGSGAVWAGQEPESTGGGAALPKLTIERLHADPPLAGELPSQLAWLPGGRRLSFVRGKGKQAKLCVFDTEKGEETVLLEAARLPIPDAAERTIDLATVTWLPDGRTLLAPADGDLFTIDVASGAVRPLVRTPENEELASASPDGTRVAFVRGNDLYAVTVATRRETRLTHGGSATLLNGRLDWVYEEELSGRSPQAFSWAPDSRSVAYLQLDQSNVPTFPIVDDTQVPSAVEWQRYPTPGAPNATVRLGVVGVEKGGDPGPERFAALDPGDGYLLPQLGWTPDGRHVVVQQLNRAQTDLQLRLLPVPSRPQEPLGTPRTILSERSQLWVNTFGAPRFLRDGRRFLWVSERDGFSHAYVCDLAGSCRAVTQGPWTVDARVTFAGGTSSLTFDERSSFVYFTATEKDPRERHLYRARLDGTGRTRLTHEDGTHRTLVAPDGRFYADIWSNRSTPPQLVVSSQDGTRRFIISPNTHPPLLDFERGTLEAVEVPAADGTTLHAALLKPADFDAQKRYPVVVNVYGGPHVQTVVDAWSQASPFDHLLASRGFLVFWLDNRGSAGRGLQFESVLRSELGRVELADQIAGVEYLKRQPFVDPARIGITGWSYGGFLTLYAVTHEPDVFRAAVAGAPVSDWRRYDSIYTERYLGLPEANPRGYDASSPLGQAKALRADLLLIHGTIDDNVHLANTIAFTAELIAAGRPHRLQLHPGQRHGLRRKEDRIARDRAVLAHFERALLGPE